MSPSASYPASVEIVDIRQPSFTTSLAKSIRNALSPSDGTKRSIPTMLLYDSKGLKLFEEITYLDEYYLTNAEIEIFKNHAREMAERVPSNAQLLELGSGNLRKVEILFREFERIGKRVDYYALDLSLSELERTFSELSPQEFEYVGFHGLHGTYEDALTWLANPENRTRPTVIMSMGSSVGNFTRAEAATFLSSFAKAMKPSDFMLIGLDACNDPERVYKAYNDSRGVTRQFYQNGLLHANKVLGSAVFDLDEWEIITNYDRIYQRHEAFYAPKRDMIIEGVSLRKGERLAVEISQKYGFADREDLWHDACLIHLAGFRNNSDDYHIHLLSSAVLDFPTRHSQYAAHSIPSLEEFCALWTVWDIVTKSMIRREHILSKPIKLRNALIFYLGHTPAFLDIHLTRALRGKPTDPKSFQALFERGIDPDVDNPKECHSHSEIPDQWPAIGDIMNYQEKIRDRVRSVFQLKDLEQRRDLAEALWIGFEHEAMHVETFLYMLLQSDKVIPPPGVVRPDFEGLFYEARKAERPNEWFTIPEQTLTVGLHASGKESVPAASFGWDMEIPMRTVKVHAFEAQGRAITNGEFARYMEASQSRKRPESWIPTSSNGYHATSDDNNGSNGHDCADLMSKFSVRTVFGPVPLRFAQDWPLMASYDEISAYAEWMKCRIPTYEEVQSIYSHAAKSKEAKPNGQSNGYNSSRNGINGSNGVNGVDCNSIHASQSSMPVFIDLDGCNTGFKHWHPTPVIQDGGKLAGQGELGGVWEWTSTPLALHEGYKPMEIYPGYSADFLNGKHNIVLGGSWATLPRIAGRTTFVNWYQHNYPYVWAGARLVRDI